MLKLIMALLIFSSYLNLFAKTNKHYEIIKTILSDLPTEQKKSPDLENKNISGEKKQKKKSKAAIPAPQTEDIVMLETGIRLFHAKNFEAALNKFNELKKKYPGSPYLDQTRNWEARTSFQQGNYKKALAVLKKINENSGEYPAALFLTGRIYQNQKLYNQAAIHFYKIPSLFPEHELADNALLRLGKLYLLIKDGNSALQVTVNIIKNYPDRETIDDAYYLLGKIFEKDPRMKNIEKARIIYKKFVSKAEKEKENYFKDSPLLNRVKNDLTYIEKLYFSESSDLN